MAVGIGWGLAVSPVVAQAAPVGAQVPPGPRGDLAAKPNKAGGARPASGAAGSTGKKVPASDVTPADIKPASNDKNGNDRVAVMPLEIGPTVPAGRPALEEAVRRGLVVSTTASVLVGPEVTTTLNAAAVRVACTEPACYQAVARTLRARHLITGTIDRKQADFVVEFKVIAASDGRIVDRQTNRCEAAECSVAELTRLTVLDLGRGVLGTDPKAEAKSSSGATAAVQTGGTVPGSAAPPAGVNSTAGAPESAFVPANQLADLGVSEGAATPAANSTWLASWRRWYPPLAIGGGVVAGAIGGYLISIDGDETCSDKGRCPLLWDMKWAGIATIGGGVALLASGIVVAVMGHDDSSASTIRPYGVALVDVGVTPTGFVLGGRF
jgi:hypothetical protein